MDKVNWQQVQDTLLGTISERLVPHIDKNVPEHGWWSKSTSIELFVVVFHPNLVLDANALPVIGALYEHDTKTTVRVDMGINTWEQFSPYCRRWAKILLNRIVETIYTDRTRIQTHITTGHDQVVYCYANRLE
jgi:hypothetical protein